MLSTDTVDGYHLKGVKASGPWLPFSEICGILEHLGCIHVVAFITVSFLLLQGNIPLYGCTTFCFGSSDVGHLN